MTERESANERDTCITFAVYEDCWRSICDTYHLSAYLPYLVTLVHTS